MNKNEKNKKIQRPLSYWFGTGLILFSCIGFTLTFFPLAKLYLFPAKINAQETIKKDEFSIEIPIIEARSKIIENVDPFLEKEYKNALKKGVAHAAGTGLPGESKMMFLFAHSSGFPWEMTWYNTIFLRLSELQKNDMILVNYKGRRYTYAVTQKKEVWPRETNYLLNPQTNELILQTCTPIGTSLKRLLVFAKPLS